MNLFAWMWIAEFPAWMAQRMTPALRGQPVIVHRGGHVIARSDEAQERGINVGWTVARAQSLVPQVLAVPYDAAACALWWESVLDELWQLTPRLETEAEAEAASGYQQGRAGQAQGTTGRRRSHRKEAGHQRLRRSEPGRVCFEVPSRREERRALLHLIESWGARCGIATDRARAELAAYVAPAGHVQLVNAGGASAFARAVPLRTLVHAGVSASTIERLEWFGMTTVADLRSLKRDQLVEQFPEGELLARFGHAGFAAREVRPVASYCPPPRLEARHVFETAATQPGECERALRDLLQETTQELAGRGAGVLWIGLTLRGQKGLRGASRILREPVTAVNTLWEPAQKLLQSLLLGAQRSESASHGEHSSHGDYSSETSFSGEVPAIETLAVRLGHLQTLEGQHSLFETRTQKRAVALQRVLEHLEKRCPRAVLRLHECDAHAVLCEERFAYVPALPLPTMALPTNHAAQVPAAPMTSSFSAKRR